MIAVLGATVKGNEFMATVCQHYTAQAGCACDEPLSCHRSFTFGPAAEPPSGYDKATPAVQALFPQGKDYQALCCDEALRIVQADAGAVVQRESAGVDAPALAGRMLA